MAHDASTATICGFSKLGRVTIGDYVYIGHNSTVLCNVRIGDNVIIGAGSLVNKDLPSNGVYAGVPAKYICSIYDFKKKNIEARNDKPFFEKNFIYWQKEATFEEKQQMKKILENSCGYIQSRIIE